MVKINPDKYFKDMFARTEDYAGNVQQIYAGAITQLTELAIAFKPKEGETFSFDANEKMKGKATNILRTMNANVYGAIQGGVKAEWTQSNIKNDKLVAAIFGKDAFEKNHFARYFDRNEKAMNAFMDRSKKEGGLGLSQKVWNYTGQLKAELEVALDLGIGEGGSAAHISKAVRSYLNEPDKLFKRVQITTKDAEGNITKTGRYKLSKAAQAYHPGQGVYRSSYKNAMRLTRTETNMAYLTADHERWQQFDFVVGYEVKLSSNHPVTDICNDFAGKYPKTFKFVGWHPQCRCFVIAILCTDKELGTLSDALLNGNNLKNFRSVNQVTDLPKGYNDWIAANAERVKTAKSIPYFIRNNYVDGDLFKGLNQAKPILGKTLAEKEVIQTKWDERKKQNEAVIQDGEALYFEANKFPELDTAKLQELIKLKDISGIKAEAKLLEQMVLEAKAEENHLSTLLTNIKDLKAQHGIEATRELFKAVETKLANWESLSLEQQSKKLAFEIDWVEKNKKYSTWEGSQNAYKKRLAVVEYQIDKQAVQDSLSDALAFSLKTKSAIVKQMVDDLQQMLNTDASISSLKANAKVLNDKVNKLIASSEAKKVKKNVLNINPDAFSQDRKDQALWAKSAFDADKKVRGTCEAVWKSAKQAEKEAAYKYTAGSSYINEPLRNMHYSGQYSGVYNGTADANHLANLIGQSSYDFDMWIQRGVGSEGVNGVFGIDLSGMTLNDARSKLIGQSGIEKAFSSCGNSKGTGFSDRTVTYNIYCPKGTKMLYSEPFSAFGHGAKSASWNGTDKQSIFGYEAEMILQKGSQFRVAKIEKTGSRWFIDVEVIAQ